MDQIKEAFDKVKQDILSTKLEISEIKKELKEIQLSILNLIKNQKKTYSTQKPQKQAIRHINSTDFDTSTHPSTDNYPFKTLKQPYFNISIGNKGVSTDRQTDTSTDTSTRNKGVKNNDFLQKNPSTSIILTQLDEITKEFRFKIKKLTKQEMIVLSLIYQLEDQGITTDYQILSQKLGLSESSIRDYVQRIINKGLELTKEKLNNKKVILHIPKEIRRLASLNTILELRES